MAIVPPSNDAFFREVDDELRRDRMTRLWARWGIAIGVAIVLVLAAFGGWLYWQHREQQAAGVEGEQLQAAYDKLAVQDAAGATTALAPLAASSNKGYRALALFTQADILLQKDDLRGAAAKFAVVAGDASLAQPFRDLALIRQTSAEFDTIKPQVAVERLRALAVPGGAWLGSAGELMAAAYLRMGRRDLAGQMFGRIASGTDVPATIRQRAVQMASQMGVDAAPSPANEDQKSR